MRENESTLQRHVKGNKQQTDKVRKFGNLTEQLKAVRSEYKTEFNEATTLKHRPSHVEDTCATASQTTDATIFPIGTTVVLGNSMINQLTNEGLSGKN